MGDGFARATEHLERAASMLRAAGGAALDMYGAPEDRLPEIRAWLARLADDPAEFDHRCYPSDTLLAAQAWRLACPDAVGPSFPEGTERTKEGWRVTEPVMWFGDTHVPGPLDVRAPLVVVGSLRVDGLLEDGDVCDSHLAVFGDTHAGSIMSMAEHLTLGHLTAAVIFCSNNDGVLTVGGDLTAEMFAPNGHAWECEGEVRARVIGEGDDGRVPERLAAWLPPDYANLADDEGIDEWRVLHEAAAGRSPVLAAPRAMSIPPPAALRAAIASPRRVRDLDLTRQRLYAIPVEIAALTRLFGLTVDHTPLATLDNIQHLPALRSLSLRHTPVRSLAPLAGLPGLLELDVSYCREITDWSALVELVDLRRLVAHGCALPDDVRAALAPRLGDYLEDGARVD